MARYKLFKKYQWALLSGVLIGTSYIPFFPWASLFGLVPLWWEVHQKELSFKQVFLRGWITQFVLTLIGFHWIAHTAHEFGFMPWFLAIPVLILFCSFVHWYIPVALGAWWGLRRIFVLEKGVSLALLVIFTVLLEWLWPSIFPWNFGYSWYWSGFPLYQIADLIGFQGLSALTLAANGSLVLGVLSFSQGQKTKARIQVFSVVLCFLLFNGLGWIRGQPWHETDAVLNVMQVQANIGNFDKWMAEKGEKYRQVILDKYTALTREGLSQNPGVQLIVWPETAYPDLLDPAYLKGRIQQQLLEFQKSLHIPLLTGAYSKEGPETNKPFHERLTYNGLFLLNEGIPLSPPYRKSVLLAFGEYLPLSETFPWIKNLVPFVGNFGRGPGPTIYKLNDLHLGLQICYEGLYPDFSRALVSQGADLIFNVTNDSWFGAHFEPYQHLYMTLARAIETRRPVVRNTNTGISTVALANGTLLEQSPLFQEWTGIYEVKFKKDAPLTFYVEYGHFWPYLLGLVGLALIVTRKKRARLESSRLE